MRLILASASPRRADLLEAAGFEFVRFPVDVDERILEGEPPELAVARLAESKAVQAGTVHPDDIVIAADTLVVAGGKPLGKPANDEDAARTLRLLSGRTHEVLTGLCVQHRDRRLKYVETTRVRMATLDESDIAWYVSSLEPHDKAGAYAVQGLASRFVEGIDGSYTNVVGLPVSRVRELLQALGCDILRFTKSP